MVAVNRNTADQGDGQAENTTLVPDISIHLMWAHVLVTRAADMITHLVVLVTRGRPVAVVQPTQVQWLIVAAWVAHGAFCTLTWATGLFTASGLHMALAAIAIIAAHTELWCGKMVAVNRNTADQGDGQVENITLLPDLFIHLMWAHVLVTRAVILTEHSEATVIDLHQSHVQPPQPQPQPQPRRRCIRSRCRLGCFLSLSAGRLHVEEKSCAKEVVTTNGTRRCRQIAGCQKETTNWYAMTKNVMALKGATFKLLAKNSAT